jgi:hypothetical protein
LPKARIAVTRSLSEPSLVAARDTAAARRIRIDMNNRKRSHPRRENASARLSRRTVVTFSRSATKASGVAGW